MTVAPGSQVKPKLADLSGLTEEQIRRYEDNDYQDASFLEVKFVLDALDIRVQKADFLVPLDREEPR